MSVCRGVGVLLRRVHSNRITILLSSCVVLMLLRLIFMDINTRRIDASLLSSSLLYAGSDVNDTFNYVMPMTLNPPQKIRIRASKYPSNNVWNYGKELPLTSHQWWQPSSESGLLVNHIINPSFEDNVELMQDINYEGWWPDCNQPCDIAKPEAVTATQGNALRIQCSRTITGYYQYVPVRVPLGVHLEGFMVSVKLWEEDSLKRIETTKEIAHIYGMLVQVRYSDGDITQHVLNAGQAPVTSGFETVSTIVEVKKKPVESIMLFLTCVGFTGTLWLDDIGLYPKVFSTTLVELPVDIMSWCPWDERPRPKSPSLVTQTLQFGRRKIVKTPRSVTLVTQVTVTRLEALKITLGIWHGPMAVALYIEPRPTDKRFDDTVKWAVKYIRKELRNIDILGFCEIILVYAARPNEPYPINSLRNIALKYVKTDYLFILDGDFVPSPNLSRRIMKMLEMAEMNHVDTENSAFVVPAFSLQKFQQISDLPSSKLELITYIQRGTLTPFKFPSFVPGHHPTNYDIWWNAHDIYNVSYVDKYEPYVVLRRSMTLPVFDERFSGYGMNKLTYLMELSAAGYRFAVLPDVWVTHLPHPTTAYLKEFRQMVDERINNRGDRYEFIATLMNRYKLGSCSELTQSHMSTLE